MRSGLFLGASAALVALFAGACAATAPAPTPEPAPAQPAQAACEEPRPQVCTMIYAPVCAQHSDGSRETHASACNACADDTVSTYVAGPCAGAAQP